MRYSAVFVALFLSLSVSAAPHPQNRGGSGVSGSGGKSSGGNSGAGNGGAGQNGKGGAAKSNAGAGAANGTVTGAGAGASAANGTDTASAANSTATGAGAGAANSTAAANSGSNGDAQTSTTLDPKVIAPGFANNGQDVPTAGQVASLTSTNNFINFCLTVPNLPITNGQQIKTGSCNPAPMGIIPSTSNMPSSKFTFPANGQTIAANQAFTISMAVSNFATGNFVNADENYFSAPQQVNGQGQIIGHSHVVVEALSALDQTTPTNPNVFAFFKGLNAPAQNGILTAAVTAGLPAGVYKVSSINTAANHQPVLVPIAQHGSLDDVVYFTVSNNAAAVSASNSTAAASGLAGTGTNNTATDSGAATDTSVGAAASTASASGSKGAKGANGAAASISVASTSTGAAGAAAATGGAKGAKGAAASSTSTSAAGAAAATGGAKGATGGQNAKASQAATSATESQTAAGGQTAKGQGGQSSGKGKSGGN